MDRSTFYFRISLIWLAALVVGGARGASAQLL